MAKLLSPSKRVRCLCYLCRPDGTFKELHMTHMLISSFSYIKLLMLVLSSFLSLFCLFNLCWQNIQSGHIKVHGIFVLPTRMLVFIDLLLEEDKEENVTILPGRHLKLHSVLFLLSWKRGSASMLQEALGSRQVFLVCLFSNSRLCKELTHLKRP